MSETEAVAEAWASIDGKLTAYQRCRNDPAVEAEMGHYEGYLADAEELISRIKHRGYKLVEVAHV